MKEIPGFENLYSATEDGHIWSHYKNRFLSPSLGKNGYLKVTLIKDKHQYTKLVHRLIAETFLPNPNNLPVVNHKDENKSNNNIINLEWCNYQYNSNYGNNPKIQSAKMTNFLENHPDFNKGKNNAKSIPIKCLETEEIFDTFSAAAKWCGLKDTTCFTDYFKGRQSSAGTHPITKQKLHWQKFENNIWIDAIPYQPKIRNTQYYSRRIKCIETQEIFNSIKDAQNYYKISHISECCNGSRKTAGGKHWIYIDSESIPACELTKN